MRERLESFKALCEAYDRETRTAVGEYTDTHRNISDEMASQLPMSGRSSSASIRSSSGVWRCQRTRVVPTARCVRFSKGSVSSAIRMNGRRISLRTHPRLSPTSSTHIYRRQRGRYGTPAGWVTADRAETGSPGVLICEAWPQLGPSPRLQRRPRFVMRTPCARRDAGVDVHPQLTSSRCPLPAASALRYSRTSCARDWPTFSAWRIRRLPGTSPRTS
jgi:hypothetical protein